MYSWLFFLSLFFTLSAHAEHQELIDGITTDQSLSTFEQNFFKLYQSDELLQHQATWLNNQRDIANSFLSAQPRLLAEVKTDQWNTGKSMGYQNNALGIMLPLWWPGERPLASEVADKLTTWQAALLKQQQQTLRLSLYTQFESLIVANENLHHLKIARQLAEQLLDTVKKRYDVGDTSEFDYITARADVEQRTQEILIAQQQLDDQLQAYKQLTNQTKIPVIDYNRNLKSTQFYPAKSPSIHSKEKELQLLHAQYQMATKFADNKPELTVAAEQDQNDRFSPTNNVARITLTVPLNTTSHRTQTQDKLGFQKAQLTIELAQLMRTETASWYTFLHRYNQSQTQLEQQKKLNQTLNKQYDMAVNAYRAGELDLRELMRIKKNWLEGQHTAELLVYAKTFSRLSMEALQATTDNPVP